MICRAAMAPFPSRIQSMCSPARLSRGLPRVLPQLSSVAIDRLHLPRSKYSPMRGSVRLQARSPGNCKCCISSSTSGLRLSGFDPALVERRREGSPFHSAFSQSITPETSACSSDHTGYHRMYCFTLALRNHFLYQNGDLFLQRIDVVRVTRLGRNASRRWSSVEGLTGGQRGYQRGGLVCWLWSQQSFAGDGAQFHQRSAQPSYPL